MTKPNLGAKRLCQGCGARFYDLGHNPAKCPKCGVANDINTPVKTRRSRSKVVVDHDEPLVAAKAKAEARQKPKKPVKEIEGIDLGAFEDIEPIDSEEEIEELDEIEDIDTLEELEDIEEPADGDELSEDAAIEAPGEALVDGVEEDEEDEEDEDAGKRKAAKGKAKPLPVKAKPKPKVKAKKK